MTPGERIRRLRTARGMTTQQLAELCGVAAPVIYMWEKDKITPDADAFAAAMRALGVESEPQACDPQACEPIEHASDAEPEAIERAPAEPAPAEPPVVHIPPRIPLASTTPKAPEARGARTSSNGVALIARVYASVRDFADTADAVELATAMTMLQESLKVVRTRLKQLSTDTLEDEI